MLWCKKRLSILLLLAANCGGAFWGEKEEQQAHEQDASSVEGGQVHYGVDVSFPIHYHHVSTNYDWLPHNLNPSISTPKEFEEMAPQPLGNKKEFYDNFMKGCRDAYGSKGIRCQQTENDRVAMNLRQPQSMQNYTDVGFKKIRAPDQLWELIKKFWEDNKEKQTLENWGVGNTYVNNWDCPTYMVSVEDSKLRGGGRVLKQAIWEAARSTIQAWTGEELTECSLYGVRVYKEGAILATHVDRLPLVSSAIINVAQDVDEPWPLEVYNHKGEAVNVTMEPGDMVLYESHSILHGRPFPLKGRFLANIFVHFEPVGHSLRHDAAEEGRGLSAAHAKYRDSLARGHGGHENEMSDGLPPYVVPGTPEETNWRRNHPEGFKSKRNSATTGSQQTVAHVAAQAGDLELLQLHVKNNRSLVNAKDANGWTPLHEGTRGGFLDVVKYLVENGSNVNEVTEEGYTPLYYAKHVLEPGNPLIEYFESLGALDFGPDL